MNNRKHTFPVHLNCFTKLKSKLSGNESQTDNRDRKFAYLFYQLSHLQFKRSRQILFEGKELTLVKF